MARKLKIEIDMDSGFLNPEDQSQVTPRLGALLNNVLERYDELHFLPEDQGMVSGMTSMEFDRSKGLIVPVIYNNVLAAKIETVPDEPHF